MNGRRVAGGPVFSNCFQKCGIDPPFPAAQCLIKELWVPTSRLVRSNDFAAGVHMCQERRQNQ